MANAPSIVQLKNVPMSTAQDSHWLVVLDGRLLLSLAKYYGKREYTGTSESFFVASWPARPDSGSVGLERFVGHLDSLEHKGGRLIDEYHLLWRDGGVNRRALSLRDDTAFAREVSTKVAEFRVDMPTAALQVGSGFQAIRSHFNLSQLVYTMLEATGPVKDVERDGLFACIEELTSEYPRLDEDRHIMGLLREEFSDTEGIEGESGGQWA